MGSFALALAVAQNPDAGSPIPRTAPPAVARRAIQTTDGQTIEGQVLSEGMSDLALRTGDKRIVLLRKQGDQYRQVTSQADWPTYHGSPGGNRYSALTQIDRSNVARLAPKWIFPLPNAAQVENTPLVVEGLMYVSNANECWALDAGSGRQVWHYQRARTKGITGSSSTRARSSISSGRAPLEKTLSNSAAAACASAGE